VEDTLTAQTKGHGLGLSIVKDLVLRNNMTIKVNSSPGLGTTFTLSFPLSDSQNHTIASSPNEQKKTADVYK
jgi:signal transduction histidine kinase